MSMAVLFPHCQISPHSLIFGHLPYWHFPARDKLVLRPWDLGGPPDKAHLQKRPSPHREESLPLPAFQDPLWGGLHRGTATSSSPIWGPLPPLLRAPLPLPFTKVTYNNHGGQELRCRCLLCELRQSALSPCASVFSSVNGGDRGPTT